jgi:bacterial/archaeal transporter family-2 protein
MLGGAATALQVPINAYLRRYCAHPMQATLLSFSVGLVIALAIAARWGLKEETITQLRSAPWWAWLGGAMGVIFVTTNILVSPRLGVAITLTLVMVAQLITSAVIDHFGFFGIETRTVSLSRVAGIALIFAGVIVLLLNDHTHLKE